MAHKNLEDVLKSAKNPVDLLRNSQIGAYVYPVVPGEFSNWRDEQARMAQKLRAVRSVAPHGRHLHQGPRRAQAAVRSRDQQLRELPHQPREAVHSRAATAATSSATASCSTSRRTTSCSSAARRPRTGFSTTPRPASTDVTIKKDDRSPGNPKGKAVNRISYRFQIQGPNAWKLIEKLNGKKVPDLKFFYMDSIKIGGQRVRTLRHGMAGAPGLEIWGPYKDREKIRETIIKAGEEFGLHQVGSRAYATNTLESGWIPSPLPAVYTDERMKKYRKWLPANSYEATGGLAGSFVSNNIEDYYVTPYEIGYGPFVKFDHEFIGREALEKMANKPHRRKVTFAWNGDDVAKVFASMVGGNDKHYKYIDLPLSNYASASFDKIVDKSGKTVGASMFAGYSYNEKSMLSLGIVDPNVQLGDEVSLVWGEPNGGTKKVTVERARAAQHPRDRQRGALLQVRARDLRVRLA